MAEQMNEGAGSTGAGGAPAAPAQNSTPVQSQGNQAPAGDSAQSLGWRAGLPKEYQNHEAFSRYGKVGDLAKDYLDLRDRSQRMISIPTETSTPEEVAAYYKAIGRPDDVNGYELPEGAQSNPGLDLFRKAAHEAGLGGPQWKKLVGHLSEAGKQAVAQQSEAKKKALADADRGLQEEWKDQYKAKRELAMRAFQKFADPDTQKTLAESGVVNEPWFIRLMASTGAAIGEGGFVKGAAPAKPAGRNFIVDYHTQE